MNEREQAISNLRAVIAEGRLIRKEWHREENGRKLVCLYYALAGSSDTGACPSWLMPKWLAYLTPWIDDAGTEAHWPAVIEKYADLAGRWHVLTPEAWTRLDFKCRRFAVAFSRKYADGNAACLSAIDAVLALLDRAISGDMPTNAEWAAAGAAARAAARAAAGAAEWAAAGAAEWAAAGAAEWAAAGAAEWAAAGAAEWAAAWAAARDEIIDGILAAIDGEIITAEEATHERA